MTSHSGANGHERQAKPASPTFAQLREAAGALLRKADEIAGFGPPAPLAQQWQGVFATARAAVAPPVAESAAVAAFGLRALVGHGETLAALSAVARTRAQALAATIVELQADGRSGSAAALASLVVEISGDSDRTVVLPFFICLEALVRCRLAQDAGGSGPRAAATYWRIALREAEAAGHPRLLLCAGLSGSGKSFVGAGVAAMLGARLVASDRVRKALAGLAPTARVPEARAAEVYGSAMSARVYGELLARAEADLAAGGSVLLDATYLTRAWREPPLALAARLGVPAVVLWCRLSEPAALARLQARAAHGWAVSDADARIRAAQQATQEPPTGSEKGAAVILIDTDLAPALMFERLLPRVERALRAR